MQTEEGKHLRTPKWEKELLRKHREQMDLHQMHFGPLGEPQTKRQKASLKKTLKAQERESA